jgi:hypothetical protein
MFIAAKCKAERALSLKSKKRQRMYTQSEDDSSLESGSDDLDDIKILKGDRAAKTSGKKVSNEPVTEDDCQELSKLSI